MRIRPNSGWPGNANLGDRPLLAVGRGAGLRDADELRLHRRELHHVVGAAPALVRPGAQVRRPSRPARCRQPGRRPGPADRRGRRRVARRPHRRCGGAPRSRPVPAPARARGRAPHARARTRMAPPVDLHLRDRCRLRQLDLEPHARLLRAPVSQRAPGTRRWRSSRLAVVAGRQPPLGRVRHRPRQRRLELGQRPRRLARVRLRTNATCAGVMNRPELPKLLRT